MTDAELMAEASAKPSRQREARGRELPKDPEMEICLLACAIMDAPRVHALLQEMGLTADWFAIPQHALIYRAWLEIVEAGKGFDVFILTKHLRVTKQLDDAGGAAFITQLATYLPTVANARQYVETIGEKHTLRNVIKAATEAIESAYGRQDDVLGVVQQFEHAASTIALARHKPRNKSIYDAVGAVFEKCNRGQKEEVRGLSTGYPQLDAYVRGLVEGNMWAVGGETSAGKTSFAMNIVHNVSVKRDEPVKSLIISCEMSTEEITEVLLQIGSGVNVDTVADSSCTEAETRAFTKAGHELAHAPIVIRDETDLSIDDVRSIARKEKPRIIVIDYVQLLRGGKRKYDRADLEIIDVSRGAKNMASELGATVIALTQLNEDGKTEGSRRISKDANQVLVVADEEGGKVVRICKQRRGKKGQVSFGWLGFCQKFTTKH